MKLEGRLRKLEAELPSDPVPSPFIEWASTLPIDDIRALRDYLRAWDAGESEEVLATPTSSLRGTSAALACARSPMSLRRRLEILERLAVPRCTGPHIVLAGEPVAGCDCGLVLVAEGRLPQVIDERAVPNLRERPGAELCL